MKEFMRKIEVLKYFVNRYVLPVLAVSIVALVSFGFWGLGTFVAILFVAVSSINFVWFVPTGFVGYKRVMSKLRPKSYKDGVHFRWPFVTDTYLMDVRVITKTLTDTKKVLTRNNVDVEYTLTYQVDERYAHLLFRYMGDNYFDTHIIKWVDAVFDTFVSKLTYPQLQTQKAEIERIASALVAQEIDRKCSEVSADEGFHEVQRYDFKADVKEAIDLDEDGVEEEVPVLELVDLGEEEVNGVNFFKSFDLKINKVTFEAGYEDARANVAIAKAEKSKAEIDGAKAVILAEKQAKVIEIKAAAEAEALKKKGAAENEVKRVLGEVLNSHPELLKEQLAKNFPKVFGGANPMINLEDMLKGGE